MQSASLRVFSRGHPVCSSKENAGRFNKDESALNTWKPLSVGNVQPLNPTPQTHTVHDRGQEYDRVKQNREEEDRSKERVGKERLKAWNGTTGNWKPPFIRSAGSEGPVSPQAG